MTTKERLKYATLLPNDSSKLTAQDFNEFLTPAQAYAYSLIPKRLYRYRPVSTYSMEEVLFGYIYAGPAFRLNDPNESLPLLDLGSICEEFKNLYPNVASTDENRLRTTIDETFADMKKWYGESIHIASLSEQYDNELMWSHYADGHKGFVLGYEPTETLAQDQIYKYLWPVVYKNKCLEIVSTCKYNLMLNCYRRIMKESGHQLVNDLWMALKPLFKNENWEYESEWRFISWYAQGNMIPEHFRIWCKPKVVYYGKNINDNDMIRIHTYAIMNNLEEYCMTYEFHEGEYKLAAIPFKIDPQLDAQCHYFISCAERTNSWLHKSNIK